ncbi:uncharacterized protein LOC119458679 [Dermacentor silvarum]|uniref:uncharacterized protein LOC119458679 n=1 Tax=Dermacentor silvarum TaxID=543639 RepID=UPI002101669E|nr:uncharacterized protein LOC119458679 [Dermacentor silvarum]
MESSSAGQCTASPDSAIADVNSASAASAGGEPSSHRGGDNAGAADTATSTSGRTPDSARSASGTGGGEQVPHQMTHSYSLSAIPTDQGHRDKKRSTARSSLPTGYSEASYRNEDYAPRQSPQQQQFAAHQQMDSLPRPYPPQSKSYGYAPKDLARSMGSTALQREDSSGGYAMESSMAKGDPGRAVRIDYRAPVPHGMSRSLPKQSYFPDEEGERVYYPSRSAVCLQDVPQKQQYAEPYYTPHMHRKADPGGRVSSSSSFKPKRVVDDRHAEQRYYAPYSAGLVHPMVAYDDLEYRKKMAAYTGDQRWMYNRYQTHHQQYAVHMMQEAGGNEACREAGDTVVVKSSGDSGGEVSKYAAMSQQKLTPEDVSSMYVIVRDAQTGTDTPLPATVDIDESPPPSKAAEMPLLGEVAARRNQEASGSSSSSSSSEDEEEESSSSESSSSSATPVNPAPTAEDFMTPEVAQQRLIAQQLQQLQLQHQQHLMNMTQQEYADYQEALRIYENYCQQLQQQQQQQQQQLMAQQQQQRQQLQQQQQQMQQQNQFQQQSHQQLQQQNPFQQQSHQQLQQQQQQPPLQPQQLQQQKSQQQFHQQQQLDLRGALPEKKKSVYFAGATTEGAGEMAVRVPGEGSSIRSFQSRTSGDVGPGEVSVEDNRSLLSSNTNMVTPLLRPLLPERAGRTATKDKMEHLCLAVNVILFSVLAGVVAAFIVQQVTHAM